MALSGDSTDTTEGYGSTAGTQAQKLLGALKAFIVPIVRATQASKSGVRMNQDQKQTTLGPEAEELLIALQKFVLATMAPQAGSNVGIEADLEGTEIWSGVALNESSNIGGWTVLDDEDSIKNTDGSSDQTLALEPSDSSDIGAMIVRPPNNNSSSDLSEKHSIVLQVALEALRRHVHNNMPIRLLCFKSDGPKLKITLLEKGGIFAYLEGKVRALFSERQFLAKIQTLATTRIRVENRWLTMEQWMEGVTKYAILSHTWIHSIPGEVTYNGWNKTEFSADQPGYEKLVNFCKIAERNHGVELGWMDTVCINKESSSELDESIRSMYKWYSNASICVVYLAQTTALSDMRDDLWFTRGWTLQELLAPRSLKFYTASWQELVVALNDKKSPLIHQEITKATTITPDELLYFEPSAFHALRSHSDISRRMQWAANRQVTRQEDVAYSLMGIFNVSMSTAYGEGAKRAFFRLLKKIMVSSAQISDIFNWAGDLSIVDQNNSVLLPPSPHFYLCRSDALKMGGSTEPIVLTHLGFRIQLLLAPALLTANPHPPYRPIGSYFATVDICCVDGTTRSKYTGRYNLLDEQLFRGQHSAKDKKRLTFGVMNFLEYATRIVLPEMCLAVGLRCSEPPGKVTTHGQPNRVYTNIPIVFHFSNKSNSSLEHSVLKSELDKHGMQLVTLYL